MTPYLLFIVLLFILAINVATAKGAGEPRTRPTPTRIMETIVSVWTCQDQLGHTRSNAGIDWGARTVPGRKFQAWALNFWTKRRADCIRALHNRTIASTWDWPTAVRLVQRIYPGTADWLLTISRREGGHGRFVMNHQGSGAGGWMQFMASTYYAYNDRAYADARQRGFIIDERTNTWRNPLGQAVTAGYMRYVGLDGCHWCL